MQNVVDCDATLILYFGRLQGGTEQTLLHCVRRKRPYKLIDASEVSPIRGAQLAFQFVAETGTSTLNIAGPRASQAASGHRFAYDLIRELLRLQAQSASGA